MQLEETLCEVATKRERLHDVICRPASEKQGSAHGGWRLQPREMGDCWSAGAELQSCEVEISRDVTYSIEMNDSFSTTEDVLFALC